MHGLSEPAIRAWLATGCDAWLILLGKELPNKLAPAAHADLLKDRFEVVLHRVCRDVKRLGDLRRRLPLRYKSHNFALAARERVRLHDELGDLNGSRYLDNHGDLPIRMCAGRPRTR